MRLFSWIATSRGDGPLRGRIGVGGELHRQTHTRAGERRTGRVGVARCRAPIGFTLGRVLLRRQPHRDVRGLTPGAAYSTPREGCHGTSMATGQLPSCAVLPRPTAFR